MMRSLIYTAVFLFVLLTGSGLACKKENGDPVNKKLVNAIVLGTPPVEVDGCGWILKVDSVLYSPDNLPDQFKVNNLNVNVSYQVITRFSPCGWGNNISVVHIDEISKQ